MFRCDINSQTRTPRMALGSLDFFPMGVRALDSLDYKRKYYGWETLQSTETLQASKKAQEYQMIQKAQNAKNAQNIPNLQNTTKTNTLKTSVLAKETLQNIHTQKTQNKYEILKEKYKNIYTPLPMSYSMKDEVLLIEKIKKHYPNYAPDYLIKPVADRIAKEMGLKFYPIKQYEYLGLAIYLPSKKFRAQDVLDGKDPAPVGNYWAKSFKELEKINEKLVQVFFMAKQALGFAVPNVEEIKKIAKKIAPTQDPYLSNIHETLSNNQDLYDKNYKNILLNAKITELKRKNPINTFFKRGFENARELTNFVNKTVYERLENKESMAKIIDEMPMLIRQNIDANYVSLDNPADIFAFDIFFDIQLEPEEWRTTNKYSVADKNKTLDLNFSDIKIDEKLLKLKTQETLENQLFNTRSVV